MENKPPKSPLKRDEHNELDRSHAKEVTEQITQKLITESRDFQKEMMMRNARENRRDIIVKVILYQRNSIDGHVVGSDRQQPEFEKLSDDPLDPFLYKYFEHIDGEIYVREMPMPLGKAGRWQMGMFKALSNYLARMNVFNNV
jgi:hypothetical protein